MAFIPLALYVHVPWCIRKCPYCDFNSHHAPSSLPEKQYIQALLVDLAQELPYVWGRRLESIFIGGGTPSLFTAEGIDELLSGIRALIPVRPNLEITLEANPGTFEQEKFKGFRATGVNRLSVGIQSFNPQHLKALGRVHNQAEALKAAEVARYAGFDNFNLDLMFGLPEQSLAEALADLQQAINLQPMHLSWYQLTLEPNTLFYKQPPHLPDDDLLVDMQLAGQALLQQAGYQQYEVSAYAQPERTCRHNINYWQFGDYLGIGAGAHGKITDAFGQVTRQQKYRQPNQYLQQALAGQARSATQTLTETDLKFEFMLNALRFKAGFDLSLFTERTGLDPTTIQQPLELAQQKAWLHLDGQHVTTTELGWQFLNTVIQLFLDD